MLPNVRPEFLGNSIPERTNAWSHGASRTRTRTRAPPRPGLEPGLTCLRGGDGGRQQEHGSTDSGQGSGQGWEAGQSHHLSVSWQEEQKAHLSPRLDSNNKEGARELRGYQ